VAAAGDLLLEAAAEVAEVFFGVAFFGVPRLLAISETFEEW